MIDKNKQNLQYFEEDSMKALFETMKDWQEKNEKRLLSTTIHKDNDKFCCIALTNPTEVVITNIRGTKYVDVTYNNKLVTIDKRE